MNGSVAAERVAIERRTQNRSWNSKFSMRMLILKKYLTRSNFCAIVKLKRKTPVFRAARNFPTLRGFPGTLHPVERDH